MKIIIDGLGQSGYNQLVRYIQKARIHNNVESKKGRGNIQAFSIEKIEQVTGNPPYYSGIHLKLNRLDIADRGELKEAIKGLVDLLL